MQFISIRRFRPSAKRMDEGPVRGLHPARCHLTGAVPYGEMLDPAGDRGAGGKESPEIAAEALVIMSQAYWTGGTCGRVRRRCGPWISVGAAATIPRAPRQNQRWRSVASSRLTCRTLLTIGGRASNTRGTQATCGHKARNSHACRWLSPLRAGLPTLSGPVTMPGGWSSKPRTGRRIPWR